MQDQLTKAGSEVSRIVDGAEKRQLVHQPQLALIMHYDPRYVDSSEIKLMPKYYPKFKEYTVEQLVEQFG